MDLPCRTGLGTVAREGSEQKSQCEFRRPATARAAFAVVHAVARSVGGVFPFKGPRIMNATSKTALVVAFAVAAALLLLFGGGMETGTMMNGSLMGNGSMAGFSWMWIPSVVVVVLGVVLVSSIYRKK